MSARRSPVALSSAVTHELQYRVRLAGVAGGAAALMVWILTGFLLPEGPPAVGDAALGAIAFATASIVVFAFPYVASARRRHALEVMYWAAAGSAERSARLAGERRIPATPAQAVAWLERQPDTDATRSLRVFCELVIGNLPAAHALVARLPDSTSLQRVTTETCTALVRFVDGGDLDLGPLHTLAETATDGDARRSAEVDAAMLEAIAAAADERDWTVPLLALRERIGTASVSRGALLRGFWIPVIGALVGASLLLALGGYGIRALFA